MNKIFIGLIFFCFTTISVYAQDVIILKRGNELKGKVTEINLTEINYKKAENPEGPLISIAKEDVYAIKYENGTVDLIKYEIKNKEEKKDPDIVATVLYAGTSLPISYFADKQGGSALVGYTIGLDVKIKIQREINFNYCFNYIRHPFKFESSNPNPETIEGHFDIANLVVGLRLQTQTHSVQFYVCALGGVNYTSLRVKKNIGSVEGLGFVFNPEIGVMLKKFTVGLKYISANPKFSDIHNESLPIKAFQIIAGIKL